MVVAVIIIIIAILCCEFIFGYLYCHVLKYMRC